MLSQGARKVSQASEALLHAKQFKEVLNVGLHLFHDLGYNRPFLSSSSWSVTI